MNTPIPCTCLCGVTTPEEGLAIARGIPHGYARPVMLTVLATPGTLRDELHPTNRLSYPLGRDIAGIFPEDLAHNHVLNAVQLREWQGENLYEALCLAEARGGSYCDAVLLETAETLPSPISIREWAERGSRPRPILSIVLSPKLLRMPLKEIGPLMERYAGHVDHVILACAAGDGTVLPREIGIAKAILERPALANIAVGFAGGVSAATVADLGPIAADFGRHFTVKACRSLQNPETGTIDVARAIDLVTRAEQTFRGIKLRQAA